MNVKNAAAYIRVSTEDQTEYSPDAQLRELRDYAAANGMVLVKTYADEGISGRRAEKRPGFMQMVADARSAAHPFDVILVHKFDRFARNREDSIVYKSMLKRSGVEVVSIKEPLSDGAYAGVMEAIYESFAEAYSINLGQEVRKGMNEKALRGEPMTAPPFGYRMEHGQFFPDEREAPAVREMFAMHQRGSNFIQIAHWMNDHGYTTHRGTPFENRTVEYILRNPVYIGKLRWNPKRRSHRNYADPDILTVQGKHEPLIDMDTWNTVQGQIAERKALYPYHARPNYDRKHWLCGLIRCASCGATLVFTKPHYMKCNNYVRGRCPTSQHVDIALMERALISRLQADLLSAAPLQCRIVAAKDDHAITVQRLTAELERTRTKRSRLTDAYLNGALELDDFKRMKDLLEQELAQKEKELSEAKAALPSDDSGAALRATIEETLRTLTDPNRTTAEKYDAAKAIIDTCTWSKVDNLLTLTYRLAF